MNVIQKKTSWLKNLTFMYDHFLQSTLLMSDFNDPLINSIGGDEAINDNRFSLTNTMTPILCLQILLWVLKK
jgi:hypothetical protein